MKKWLIIRPYLSIFNLSFIAQERALTRRILVCKKNFQNTFSIIIQGVTYNCLASFHNKLMQDSGLVQMAHFEFFLNFFGIENFCYMEAGNIFAKSHSQNFRELNFRTFCGVTASRISYFVRIANQSRHAKISLCLLRLTSQSVVKP